MCIFKKFLQCELLDYSFWIHLGLNQAEEREYPGFKFWPPHFLTTRAETSCMLLRVLSTICVCVVQCLTPDKSWISVNSSMLYSFVLRPREVKSYPMSPRKFMKELGLWPGSFWPHI